MAVSYALRPIGMALLACMLGAGLHVAVAAADLEVEIADAERRLAELLERFTEKHPDVRIAQRKLDELLARRPQAAADEAGLRGTYQAEAAAQAAAEASAAPAPAAATSAAARRAVSVRRAAALRCDGGSTASAANRLCGRAEQDWTARASAPGVFYTNNFDYPSREAYLGGAHSYVYADTADGLPKLDLERHLTLSGAGASRHNWYAAEGPNEAGPSWNLSFAGPGAKEVPHKATRFYMQFALYADDEWARFTYREGGIKLLMLLDPSSAPFAPGEVVIARHGGGAWLSGFRVTKMAAGFQLTWRTPWIVRGDDSIYTFYDAGPVERDGETDATDIDLFEQRWGPRRRNLDPTDPDYRDAPRFEGGNWYTVEVHVDVRGGASVLKIWFAEYGAPPVLLTGYMDSGLRENTHTYRGAFLINRAENTTSWVDEDTFVLFDEVIVSDAPIPFPGGYELPWPGSETPQGWPPAGASPR